MNFPVRHRQAWILVALLAFLAGVPLRFALLERRPLMHDESLFSYYALTIKRHIESNRAAEKLYEEAVKSQAELAAFARQQGLEPPAPAKRPIPEQLYAHIPLMHGPLMLFTVGWAFHWTQDRIGVGRGVIALCSLIALFAAAWITPSRLRGWAVVALLVSPALLYYSRFYRNEMFFNAFMMAGMLLWIAGRRGGRGTRLLAGAGAALLAAMLTVKENALFLYAAALTFWGVWLLHQRLPLYRWRRWIGPRRKKPKAPPQTETKPVETPPEATAKAEEPGALTLDDLAREVTPVAPLEPPHPDAGKPPQQGRLWYRGPAIRRGGFGFWTCAVLGVAVGAVFTLFIYSVTATEAARAGWDPFVAEHPALGTKYLRGLAYDVYCALGNLRETWAYWEGQHSEHRINGALHYHLPIMLTYELPLLILMYLGLIFDALRRTLRFAVHAIAIGAGFGLIYLWRWAMTRPGWEDSIPAAAAGFLHLTPGGSMIVLGLMIVPLLVWSVWMLWERRAGAAWCGWWAACSLFQYSAAGEKVPWLTVHIVLPFYLAGVWIWAAQWRRLARPVRVGVGIFAVLGIALAIWNDIPLIGKRAADPRERLVFNHTTPEFNAICRRNLARWATFSQTRPADSWLVVFEGEPAWPCYWYFRDQTYTASYDAETIRQASLVMLPSGTLTEEVLNECGVAGYENDGAATPWRRETIPLRRAWLHPWPENAPWRAWWIYFWTRETWTERGDQALITVLERTGQ